MDEEQRFGVKQKELLRQLRLRVDVLSLSATPIPRTLQMSLAGLRDISVIETPPEGRRPVKTYVGEYDEDLVKQAIERERARGGQTFLMHNRVESIENFAEGIRALVPGTKVAVAHGQMDESQLEPTMLGFLRGESDVLVCTTIIESGLDVSSANTLIVERADELGLAQLYQIRGRVGRSRERAYAYLFYPSSAALTEDAAARLSTLSDYTELGSGFKIAMRDLEIRGRRQPARATSSRATWRRWASSCTSRCSTRPWPRWPATPPTRPPSRCAWTCRWTPTCPATTCPTRRPRSRCTAASRARARWPS